MMRLTFKISLALALGVALNFALLTLLDKSDTTRPVAFTAEFHVCSSGCPYSSVQAAVDAANTGDVIKIAAGTYTGASARAGVTQVVYINKSISIRGGYTTTNWTTPYPITQPTTLNAQGQGRVLYITGNISPTVEGLRLTGGNAAGLGGGPLGYYDDAGGGVYLVTATAAIMNNQIFNNAAYDGGGLYLDYSDAMLTGNTVFSNTVSGDGGGLYLWVSDATLTGNTVFSNTAGEGGGLALGGGVPTLTGNTVFSNTAAKHGGGLSLSGSAAILNGNTVSSNTANYRGGGLFLSGSAATLNGNTVSSNTANYGGGLSLSVSAATLNGNTVTSNIARFEGGGLDMYESAATLIGNIVASNTASLGDGGGLLLQEGHAMLVNNLVTDNQANSHGSGLYLDYVSSLRLVHTTITRNRGGDGSGVYVGGGTSLVMTNTILVSQTVGVTVTTGSAATLEGTLWGSGAWANDTNWGGAGTVITGMINVLRDPDFVNPAGGDYHLGARSAAVDAGVASGIATDIDGDPRPAAFGFDIGADERPGASLQLRRTAWPVVLNPGQIVTYALAITSAGVNAATNVWMTDTLPTLQQAVTITPSRGTCTIAIGWGGTAVCGLGAMAPGDTAHITLTAQVTPTLTAPLPLLMRNTVWVTATEAANTTYADTALQNCYVRLNDGSYEYNTVQAAVDAGTQATDVVKVAGYCTGVASRDDVTQMVYLSKTLTIQGGWNTAFTKRNVISYPTTLDAQRQGRVLYITGNITPTIEGLHITGGDAAGLGSNPFGGGVYVITATAIISDNQVFSSTAGSGGGLYLVSSAATLNGNTVSSNTANYRGGGLALGGGAPTLIGNIVTSNTASSGGGLSLSRSAATLNGNTVAFNIARFEGGGLDMYDSAATLSGNTFFSNTAADGGGGLYLRGGAPTLIGNIVTSNTASSGGGLSLYWGSATLINSLVSDNRASTGSGLYIEVGSPHLLQTTIVRNGGDYGGNGAYITGYYYCDELGCIYIPSTVVFTNTILVSHTMGIAVTSFNTATLEATLWGSGPWANSTNWGGGGTIITGTHNYWGDPAFVNPNTGDYHIGLTSAAIDKGVNAGVTTDIDGQPRPYQAPDLGADELWPHFFYLPLVSNQIPGPDLMVTGLTVTGDNAQVVIRNQGNAPVTDGFYVDVYLNPNPVPTSVNQIWSDGRSTQGLVWGVTDPVWPGQVVTLTMGDAYYRPDYSVFTRTLPVGTPIYAQVDSYNAATTYGAVLENHEIAGAAYNNLFGPVLSTATGMVSPVEQRAIGRAGQMHLPSRMH